MVLYLFTGLWFQPVNRYSPKAGTLARVPPIYARHAPTSRLLLTINTWEAASYPHPYPPLNVTNPAVSNLYLIPLSNIPVNIIPLYFYQGLLFDRVGFSRGIFPEFRSLQDVLIPMGTLSPSPAQYPVLSRLH